LSQLKLNLEPERKTTECLYGESAYKPLDCGDMLDFFSIHIFYGKEFVRQKNCSSLYNEKKRQNLTGFFLIFFYCGKKADVNAVFMENCFGINLEELLFYLIEALRE